MIEVGERDGALRAAEVGAFLGLDVDRPTGTSPSPVPVAA
jgi:hypothetical protein